MILMLWNSAKAREFAGSIERAMQQPVHLVSSLQEGCEHLASTEFSAALVDQWTIESEPALAATFFDRLGTAVPVFVNFGISSEQRLLRELHAALSRRALESERTRQSTRQALRDELKDDVTALLLACGMALEESALSESTRTRLQIVEQVAKQLKAKLADEAEVEREAMPQRAAAAGA